MQISDEEEEGEEGEEQTAVLLFRLSVLVVYVQLSIFADPVVFCTVFYLAPGQCS